MEAAMISQIRRSLIAGGGFLTIIAFAACSGHSLGPAAPSNLGSSGARPIPFASPKVIADYPTVTPSAGPSKPALGSDGNIWFSECTADKIGRITPVGVVTEFAIPIAGCPTRMALGPDGNIWFT